MSEEFQEECREQDEGQNEEEQWNISEIEGTNVGPD